MANIANSITLAEIMEHLYIGNDGKFRRKNCRVKARNGEIAGGLDSGGYEVIRIRGIKYRAHRLYYMIYHGVDELENDVYIDHINGIRNDNRKENLRLATHAQNGQNGKISKRNTSGHPGVYWHSRDKRWTASIGVNGKLTNLGYYIDKESAILAYDNAAHELHGDFSKV